MKRSIISGIAILSMSLLFGIAAATADDTYKDSFKIGTAILVNGKQLSAGEYQVKWEGTGPILEVSISQHDKVLLTVPARVETLPVKSDADITELRTAPDGSRTLSAVHFENKDYMLVFGPQMQP